jgi:hypothetical protein
MRSLCWWRPPCLLRRVIVNQASDTSVSLQGVLWQVRGPWLTLREVSMVSESRPPVRIEGETVIHRDQVAFIQVMT